MKKFFSKIAQRAFALAISTMVVTNTFAQGAAGIDAASSELATYMDPPRKHDDDTRRSSRISWSSASLFKMELW